MVKLVLHCEQRASCVVWAPVASGYCRMSTALPSCCRLLATGAVILAGLSRYQSYHPQALAEGQLTTPSCGCACWCSSQHTAPTHCTRTLTTSFPTRPAHGMRAHAPGFACTRLFTCSPPASPSAAMPDQPLAVPFKLCPTLLPPSCPAHSAFPMETCVGHVQTGEQAQVRVFGWGGGLHCAHKSPLLACAIGCSCRVFGEACAGSLNGFHRCASQLHMHMGVHACSYMSTHASLTACLSFSF